MSELYSDCHRQLQDRYQSRLLADRLEQVIVHSTLTESDAQFIEGRDFFFLSSVDPDGQPTVSYKGGAPGFVTIRDNTLVFPCYDGNGMFLSMGNINATAKVGLLFIDFETPRRLRVQGVAHIDDSDARERVPGAILLIRVEPTKIFVNCPRYIHRHKKIETSKHVPKQDGSAPVAQWKRLEIFHDALSSYDQEKVRDAGFISLEEAQANAAAGEG
jgi:hypothetical protein